jgi:hypothetical protein
MSGDSDDRLEGALRYRVPICRANSSFGGMGGSTRSFGRVRVVGVIDRGVCQSILSTALSGFITRTVCLAQRATTTRIDSQMLMINSAAHTV